MQPGRQEAVRVSLSLLNILVTMTHDDFLPWLVSDPWIVLQLSMLTPVLSQWFLFVVFRY